MFSAGAAALRERSEDFPDWLRISRVRWRHKTAGKKKIFTGEAIGIA